MAKDSREVSIRIREAGIEDVPVIMRFIRDIAEFENLSDEVVADEETIAESLFGEERSARVILADVDGEAAGFAVYFYNFSTFVGRPGIYLEDIFVSKDKRGIGVGGEMMRHLARIARAGKCARMDWAVLDWNPARAFYEMLGAEPLEDWVLYRISGERLERLADG
ncbi:MAG TPA: GNAT family N-acetyltransferase [Candidatus Eisenbacteria bacterium]|uniref:GNAT family N-acetyltransferase n=1 Tax=Eiseniibacteriota bacterium TaxID=2212470 RepID=A0A7V2AU74_UNCEI|nr:GNAT family N-acetyltransferase [Candidatus Eisenbacteria bacterium]